VSEADEIHPDDWRQHTSLINFFPSTWHHMLEDRNVL